MIYLNNQINKDNIYNNDKRDLIENSAKFNSNRKFETNRYIPAKTEGIQKNDYNINEINKENLIYKSIFNQKQLLYRNHSNNKEYINKENYNIRAENVNQNIEKNNYKNINIIPKKKNLKHLKYKFSKEKDDEDNSLMNYSEQRGNYNINYYKKYINLEHNSNKDKKFRQYSSNRLENNTNESDIKNKIDQKNRNLNINSRGKNNINYQNTEGNLNMIINKKDFIKNIKKLDDLNYLDEIDRKTEDFFLKTENINNLILDENYLIPSKDNYETTINYLQKVKLNSKIPEINKDLKEKVNNNKDKIQNNINEINKNVQKNNSNKILKYRQKIYNLNVQKYKNKFLDSNNPNGTRLILNNKSFYDKESDDNFLIPTNSKKFSTLSHREEQVKSEAKNLKFRNNQIFKKNQNKFNNKYKAIKYNNLSYELKENNEPNNYIKNKPSNPEFNNNYLELRQTVQKLTNDINNKSNKINALIKIIKESRKKIEILEKNNNILIEENKKNQELLKKFKKTIIFLKNNQRNNGFKNKDFSENNFNINYNYINNDKTQQNIKELEKQIEQYKKENNDLKFLLKQYKNNNYEEINAKKNLLNKFNRNDFLDSNYRKKSYSVTKNKTTLRYSIISNKTFQEDEI